MDQTEKQEVLAFLRKNPMAVISTINKDTAAPQAALVAFAETLDFEVIFQTLSDTRKYQNLENDQRIALVTGWEVKKKAHITLQYEGLARELKRGTAEYEKYRAVFEAKDTPCTNEFLDNSKSRMFVVTPLWISYSDYTQETPRIIEGRFDHS